MPLKDQLIASPQSSETQSHLPQVLGNENVKDEISQLSANFAEVLQQTVVNTTTYQDEKGTHRLTPEGRNDAHKVCDSFFSQAGNNHQLLRSALNQAYQTIKSQSEADVLTPRLWAILRTTQSIHGLNNWQETNAIYQQTIEKTNEPAPLSAVQVYQQTKIIRQTLELQNIPIETFLKQDTQTVSQILQAETAQLDRQTSEILKEKDTGNLKQRLKAWLISQFQPKDQAPSALSDYKKDLPAFLTTPITRQHFLKLSGRTIAASILLTVSKLLLDPEFQAGVKAASARPEVKGTEEKHEPSKEILLQVYQENFKDKQHLLPEQVWMRIRETDDGEKIEGTGMHLGILARNCFVAERRPNQTFDDYYASFVDRMHRISNLAGLDFITLIASLQVSAENIAGFEKPKETSDLDVKVSRVQEMAITAARAMGLEEPLIDSIGPNGLAIQILRIAEKRGIKNPLKEALPDQGIRHYDLIRFREQPTTGIMDMEPGERAEAFRTFQDSDLAKTLGQKYPEVIATYRKVHEKRQTVKQSREQMRKTAELFIAKYAHRLKPFADGDQTALKAIGISPKMDSWQFHNYSDVWYKTAEIPTNPEFAFQQTVKYFQQQAEADLQAFYQKLFSQQIRNPLFIDYLLKQANQEANFQEQAMLLTMRKEVNQYEDTTHELRVAHLDALEAEGPYEYDSNFQLMTSVLVTKRLSKIAGVFNPEDRNSLGWHIYKTCAIREIAPIPFLVDDQVFARDITIDTPYAPIQVAQSLETFTDMLQTAGILQTSPDQDILTTYRQFERMFWRDGGVWPNIPKQFWQKILTHFNEKIANRLFFDFAGLIRNPKLMPDLNKVMIENKILFKPADQDPHNFFKQLIYLQLNSHHMRRDIPEEDWNKALSFYRARIQPTVVRRTEIAPRVFEQKWMVGSADYPPIFRSQAVMYNFLNDLDPGIPESTSSSDILGHH